MMQYLQPCGASYGGKALLLVQQVHQLQEKLRLQKEACYSPGSKADGVHASDWSLAAAQQRLFIDAATPLDCSEATAKKAGVGSAAISHASYTADAAATASISPSTKIASAASSRDTRQHSSAGLSGLQQQVRGRNLDKQQPSMTEAAASEASHAEVTVAAKIAALHKAVTVLDLGMQQCKESLVAVSELLTSLHTSAAEQQPSILREHLTTADMLLNRLRQLNTCKQQVQLALSKNKGPLIGGGAGVSVTALETGSSTQQTTAKGPCSDPVVPTSYTAPIATLPSNGSAVNPDSRQHTVAPRQPSKNPICAGGRSPKHEEISNSAHCQDKLCYDRSTAAQHAVGAGRYAATVRSPTCGGGGAAAAPAAVTSTAGNDSLSPLLWQHPQATSEQWSDLHNSKKLCHTHDRHQHYEVPVSGQVAATAADKCRALKGMKPMHGTQAKPSDCAGGSPYGNNTIGRRICVQENLRKSAAAPKKRGWIPGSRTMSLQQALEKFQAIPADDQSLNSETDILSSMYHPAVTDAWIHLRQSSSTPFGHHNHELCSQSSPFLSQLLEMLMLIRGLPGCK